MAETPGEKSGVAVRTRGLEKCYLEGGERRPVLRGVDLEVRRGELVVLLGRSGSGKSTLLDLLGGLDAPDAGTVELGGIDLGALDERERTLVRRRRIGFVFQFFNLVPTLTVVENVALRLELDGRPQRQARERARGLLADVGLSDREEAWPSRLSGGEQQRVAVAAALAHEPDLVLADEPTGNLDLTTGRRVIELLDRLTRREGRTMVMATHSLEVMGVADRVLELRDGRLREPDREAAGT